MGCSESSGWDMNEVSCGDPVEEMGVQRNGNCCALRSTCPPVRDTPPGHRRGAGTTFSPHSTWVRVEKSYNGLRQVSRQGNRGRGADYESATTKTIGEIKSGLQVFDTTSTKTEGQLSTVLSTPIGRTPSMFIQASALPCRTRRALDFVSFVADVK